MDVAVNTGTLNSNKNKIIESIDSFELDVDSVKSIMGDIASIWEGSDHDTFETKMEEFLEEIKEFQESLNKYQEYITGYTTAITTLDDAYGNKSIVLK